MLRAMLTGTLTLALIVVTVTPAGAAPPVVHDFGEAGKLARLYRAPDQKLHLLYVTQKGFRWQVWEAGAWTDRGLVPDTAAQGGSKFNNPAIVSLADGSFHVAWGPTANWGVSHDVWLMSHDGASWGAKQTIVPDYTEYLALAPLPQNQILLIGGIVCPTGCTTPLRLAHSTGKAGQTFGAWTELPIKANEGKTPFVFAQPGSDVFHLVSRWSKISYFTWDGSQFTPEKQLLLGSPYSAGSPVVSALPDGSPLVLGVEWKGSGTTWAIDHVRFVQRGAGGWAPNDQGESVSAAEWNRGGVSADAEGGVHLFYFAKAGELSHRFSKGTSASPAEIVATGVDFKGPETDNLATQYTDHQVHVIAPIGGTLRHLAFDSDLPATSDAGTSDAGPDAAGAGGGGGAVGLDGSTGSTTPADAGGCGCRTARPDARTPWWVAMLLCAAGGRRSCRGRRRR